MNQELGKLLKVSLIFLTGAVESAMLELEFYDQENGSIDVRVDTRHRVRKLPLEVIDVMNFIHAFFVRSIETQISQTVFRICSFSKVSGIPAINLSTVLLSRWQGLDTSRMGSISTSVLVRTDTPRFGSNAISEAPPGRSKTLASKA